VKCPHFKTVVNEGICLASYLINSPVKQATFSLVGTVTGLNCAYGKIMNMKTPLGAKRNGNMCYYLIIIFELLML